jgi:thiamine biosynthesis lipoprotein
MRKNSVIVKKFIFGLILALSFFIGFLISQKTKPEKLYSKSKFYLGSIVEIKFYCDDDKLANQVFDQIFNEFERLDSKYSFYSNESYLAKLNSEKNSLIKIDNETSYLIKICDTVYSLTQGKFDASIGQLVNLWKKYIEQDEQKDFQLLKVNLKNSNQKSSSQIPAIPEIIAAKDKSGWTNIKLINENEIYRTRNVQLNFDAILQGYTADRAIEILKSLGIKKALVNASGEIRVLGNNWKIGIKHPRIENELIEIVKLSNYSIATSGDYEKFIEVDGKRYHHIIDPETGYPSTKNMSVTVIAKNCAFADALATGLFSLEPEQAIQIAKSLNDVYVFIVDSKNQIHRSKNFEKFLWR